MYEDERFEDILQNLLFQKLLSRLISFASKFDPNYEEKKLLGSAILYLFLDMAIIAKFMFNNSQLSPLKILIARLL